MCIRGRWWVVKLIGSSWQHKVYSTSAPLITSNRSLTVDGTTGPK